MSETRNPAPETTPMNWWIGPAIGATVSLTVTVIVVVWEWVENPGGIFRGEFGTNWKFVYDTAISWFVPTFIHVTVIAAASHLAWRFIKKHRD
mgnify:CR=1 FL=1